MGNTMGHFGIIMYYYDSVWMRSWAWTNLVASVQDNYETEENKDDAIFFGAYMTTPISQLRKQVTEECGPINKLIVYQSEPLTSTHNSINSLFPSYRKIIDSIREADEVWEFDYENALLLQKEGINVKYKPPVYTERLNHITTSDNPEIDVLFYGSFSERRAKFIRSFQDGYAYPYDGTEKIFQNFNLVWAWNLSYEKLQKYIANSKIILNLHPYDGESRQQTVRIFYALCNNKTIMSEKSNINYFGDSIHEFHDIQSMGNVLVDLLRNDKWKIKPQNYSKHFLNLKTRSNIAIFYDIEIGDDWKNKFSNQVYQLQLKGLYDAADYMHFNHKEDLPMNFYKVNRYTRDLNIDTAINDFRSINSNYKIIKVTNEVICEV